MAYAVKVYTYIFMANVLAFVIVARWRHPFGGEYGLLFGVRLSDDSRRSMGVWEKESVKAA